MPIDAKTPRIPAVEPAPMTTGALLGSIGLAAVVAVFFFHSPVLYPFRLLVTLMHETGHAVMANLVGGSVESVTIGLQEGGLTLSRYEPVFWKRMLVASGGYVGSSVAGAMLLWAAGRIRTGRFVLWFLVGWMVLVAIVWVPILPPSLSGKAAEASGFSRADGLFTLAFIAGVSFALGLCAQRAPAWFNRALVVWIATLSSLAALEDIKSLFGYGLGGSGSDADAMAEITMIPAGFWAAVWMLASLALMAWGLRSIVKRRALVVARRQSAAGLAVDPGAIS